MGGIDSWVSWGTENPREASSCRKISYFCTFLIKTSDLNHLKERGPASVISHHMSMDILRDLYHLLSRRCQLSPFLQRISVFPRSGWFIPHPNNHRYNHTDWSHEAENSLPAIACGLLLPLNWWDMLCITRRAFLWPFQGSFRSFVATRTWPLHTNPKRQPIWHPTFSLTDNVLEHVWHTLNF